MSQNKKLVKKVIIPAAGFGTRFLPQTKAMPKEMLPIVDKPVIQYVVEEAVSAGIEDVILVTGWHKRSLEDHFDNPFELEMRLKEWGKEHLVSDLRKVSDLANFIYVRQKGPYGNGVPVMCSKHLVEGEPFLVLWGDEFVLSTPSRSQQMVKVYEKYQSSVICGFRSTDPEDTKRYAFIDGVEVEDGVWRVNKLVEKPGPNSGLSNIAIISGYILNSDIFPIFDRLKPGKGGEYFLTDAINGVAQEKPVYALELKEGSYKYYDTGNKLAYLKTVVEMALRHEEVKDEFGKYLKDFVKSF